MDLMCKLPGLSGELADAKKQARWANERVVCAEKEYHEAIVEAWNAADGSSDPLSVRIVAGLMLHVPPELRPNATDDHLMDFLEGNIVMGRKGWKG